MIELKHLCKSFEDKDVLKDINAVFENGKTNLIIGQSGSGKTVLMKNIVGLLLPTSGQVLYDGRDFVAMSKREKVMIRREMGMIFQSAALFDSLNVLENVMFPLDMFSSMNYRERVRRAQECLDRVNLGDAQLKYPGEISGGMQKRVAIARAIVLNPKYLFCDEPNSGLDPQTSLVIDELIHDITQEYQMTTIVNTHDMNSVMGIGENIIFIYKGHEEWQGNKDQIMTSTNERLNSFIFASGQRGQHGVRLPAGSESHPDSLPTCLHHSGMPNAPQCTDHRSTLHRSSHCGALAYAAQCTFPDIVSIHHIQPGNLGVRRG